MENSSSGDEMDMRVHERDSASNTHWRSSHSLDRGSIPLSSLRDEELAFASSPPTAVWLSSPSLRSASASASRSLSLFRVCSKRLCRGKRGCPAFCRRRPRLLVGGTCLVVCLITILLVQRIFHWIFPSSSSPSLSSSLLDAREEENVSRKSTNLLEQAVTTKTGRGKRGIPATDVEKVKTRKRRKRSHSRSISSTPTVSGSGTAPRQSLSTFTNSSLHPYLLGRDISLLARDGSYGFQSKNSMDNFGDMSDFQDYVRALKKKYEPFVSRGPIRLVYWNCCGFSSSLNEEIDQTCPIPCQMVRDTTKQPDADGTYFHIPSFSGFPPTKPANQVWGGASMESEAYYPSIADDNFMSKFDIEMTYRIDRSLVPMHYCSRAEYNFLQTPKPKRFGIAFFASNCGSQNGRERIVSELMKYVQIDSYGRCLHNKDMPDGDRHPFSKWNLIKEYKFVLAFENSNIRDYVTEKWFQCLDAGTVPVYYGTPNIASYAPHPKSFIDANAYIEKNDIPGLGLLLQRLLTDDEEYNTYLEWKKGDISPQFKALVDTNSLNSVCGLCMRAADKKYDLSPFPLGPREYYLYLRDTSKQQQSKD